MSSGSGWLYRLAVATGSPYWWDRHHDCIGYYWPNIEECTIVGHAATASLLGNQLPPLVLLSAAVFFDPLL